VVAVVTMPVLAAMPIPPAVLAVFTGTSVLGVLVVNPHRRMLAVGGSMLWVSISVASVDHGVLEGPIVDVHAR
jgi:hypothetical protein